MDRDSLLRGIRTGEVYEFEDLTELANNRTKRWSLFQHTVGGVGFPFHDLPELWATTLFDENGATRQYVDDISKAELSQSDRFRRHEVISSSFQCV